MDVSEKIEKVENDIDCCSMFVYGSYARDNSISNDCEIAVLLDDSNIGSQSLKKFEQEFNQDNKIKFFPFSKQKFVNYNIITTFTTPIFYHEIINDGYTVYGDNILENLDYPVITKSDIMRDIGFQIGQAFTALKSYRRNEYKIAIEQTYKSGIFGSRLLYLVKNDELLTGYENIVKKVDEPILYELLKLRNNNSKIKESIIHDTLSYLRNDVEVFLNEEDFTLTV